MTPVMGCFKSSLPLSLCFTVMVIMLQWFPTAAYCAKFWENTARMVVLLPSVSSVMKTTL